MLLRSNNYAAAALLFAVVLLLRLPSLLPGYVSADESVYLATAQQLNEGASLYTDVWDLKPPVIYWVYSAFSFVFGGWALLAIRVFTMALVWLCSMLFQQLFSSFRMPQSLVMLPAFAMAVYLCYPWYTQELNCELLLLVPALLSALLLLRFCQSEHPDWRHLLQAGLLCGLGIGIKYQAAFHVLTIFVGYLLFARFRLMDVATFGFGVALSVGGMLFMVYKLHLLGSWWDVGFLFSFDYMRLGANPGETSTWLNLWENIRIWGGLVAVSLYGFWVYRDRFFKLGIAQRKVGTLMSLWLLFGLLAVLMGGRRMYLHYFWQVLPAVVFFAVFLFTQLRFRSRVWQASLYAVALLMPLFTLFLFGLASTDFGFHTFQRYINPGGWTASKYEMYHPGARTRELTAYVEGATHPQDHILVLGFVPELYVQLEREPASLLSGFSVAYPKMDWLEANAANAPLMSRDLPPGQVLENLLRHRPRLIIDVEGVFPEMARKMPLLQDMYQLQPLPNWQVYRLQDKPVAAR